MARLRRYQSSPVMANIYSIIGIFAIFFLINVFGEDSSDECIPKPPQHGKERVTCCKIPDLMKKHEDGGEMEKAFHDCIQSVKEAHPDLLPKGRHDGPPPAKGPHKPHGPPPIKFFECVQECIHNNSGLMTADMKPNVEGFKKLADEFIGHEESWKSVADEAIKKCTEATPVVKEDAVCKSGAHQTTLCLMREMYIHCPAASWTDSDDCKAEKSLMEKCPEMAPPFHHHHRHHRKN